MVHELEISIYSKILPKKTTEKHSNVTFVDKEFYNKARLDWKRTFSFFRTFYPFFNLNIFEQCYI